MKRILFALLIFFFQFSFFNSVQAQTFVGTMRVGDKTFKDVTVKLAVNDSLNTASVMIYHVLEDGVHSRKIDLLIPDILVFPSAQRTTFECHNIVPLSEGKEWPEYHVGKLNGTTSSGVFSFSCTMGECYVTYSGVVNERASYSRVSH